MKGILGLYTKAKVTAYIEKVYDDLLNSEVAHTVEFNNCDVDWLLIETIETAIFHEMIDNVHLFKGDRQPLIDAWRKDNPQRIESLALAKLEG